MAAKLRPELLPNQSRKLLQALHLLTRDGDLNADARRKLKQVNHLVGLLTPALSDAFLRCESPTIADIGSGNSYLGFVIYELFCSSRGEVFNVESRAELTAQARSRAQGLGYSRMHFVTGQAENSAIPERVHVLTALHACDTATDDALALAVNRRVDHIAVVPCCQAEVAEQLKAVHPRVAPPVASLFRHRWHRREFGSHLTNVLRALVLESFGYQVTVTELTGWEHSLKNELILGRRVHKESRDARARLEALLEATQVRPKVIRTLIDGAA